MLFLCTCTGFICYSRTAEQRHSGPSSRHDIQDDWTREDAVDDVSCSDTKAARQYYTSFRSCTFCTKL